MIKTQSVDPASYALPAHGNGPYRLFRGLQERTIRDFERSLVDPMGSQRGRLAAMLWEAQDTAFGRDHALSASDTLERADALLVKVDPILTDIQTGSEKVPELTEEIELTLSEARVLLASLSNSTESLEIVLKNFEQIDQAEIERLMREEGVKVRLVERKGD